MWAALWDSAFLYSPVVWYKNILYYKSLLTVTASDLHGETKSNRAKCITALYPNISGALHALAFSASATQALSGPGADAVLLSTVV